MTNDIVSIQNVRGYLDHEGTAWLNAEDVARGLGWTQIKNGVEYVRWETINSYLREFNFPKIVGKADFIPENMFYRLVWKSRDENALAFQAKVADEILPAIRKHGFYSSNPVNDFAELSIANPAWAIKILTDLQRKQEEAALAKLQLAEAKPKIDYCDSILQCTELVTTSAIAKDYGMSANAFNKLLHSLDVEYKQGKLWLLKQKYASLGWTQTKTYPYTDANGTAHCNVHTYWTQKGRLGLYALLKENGYLPLIEQAA